MGGSSKSSSSNTVNTSTVNTSLQGEGNISGSGNIINSADADVLKHLGGEAFGSVNKLGEGVFSLSDSLGQGAFSLAGGVSSGLLQLAANSSKESMNFVNQYTERNQLGGAAGQNDALKWVAIAAVGVAGFAMLNKGK